MVNEKRLIDANADSCGETTKIKTHHARIVVDGTAEKPYYSIEWYDPTEKEYFLGYSSYYIENVFNWLSECFEIVDTPTVDAVEVVMCKDCIHYDNSEGICWCKLNSKFFPGGMDWHGFPEDGFCSYGERKCNG